MARPTKYKKEWEEMLIEHMSKGYSQRSFCGLVGIHHSSFYNYIDKHKSFKEARDIGLSKSQLFWETMLINCAGGNRDGGAKNITAIIFSMCNMFKDSYKRADQVEADDKDKSITLNLAYKDYTKKKPVKKKVIKKKAVRKPKKDSKATKDKGKA